MTNIHGDPVFHVCHYILVVEDEPAIQELIIVRADTAEEAVKQANEALLYVALLDWMLPGMGGI